MSKKRIALFSLAILGLFLVFVIARMPAHFALGQVSKYSKMVYASQVTGTIWKGKAGNIDIRYGRETFSLGLTEWELNPWYFLRGKLGVDVNARRPGQLVSGNFVIGSGYYLKGNDVALLVDVSDLMRLMPLPFKFFGVFDAAFASIEIDDKQLVSIEGSGSLKNSSLEFGRLYELGDYGGKLAMEKNQVIATVSDIDAHVGLSGGATFNPAEKAYSIDVNLLPKETAHAAIEQSLKQFYKQQQDGSYRFTYKGQL